MKELVIKFFCVAIVIGLTIPIFPAKQSQAQFVVEFGPAATSLVGSIAAATMSTAVTTGIIGTGAFTVAAARETIGSACLGTIVSLDATDAVSTTLDATSGAALNVIGGGALELTKISAKVATATAAKACVDTYVEVLSRVPGATLETSSEVAREQDKYTKVSNSLRQKIQDLSAQQNASVKDIMKAFLIKVVLNVSKNLTTEMVNKMVEKYKISDYLAYGDALGTQVYSMKYINENFAGDKRQQMMIRSIIQSEKIPEKTKTVQAFANAKAQEYIGTACNVATPGINTSDQNYFLKCLAAYGAPEASPEYQYAQAYDQAQAANAAGRASANSELAQSQGFAPPRNCSGSLSMQQNIDTQYEKSYNELGITENVVSRLEQALKQTPPRTTLDELNKAKAARDQASANVKALADDVNISTTNDGKTKDSAIVDICEAITSPAGFVSSSINSYLSKHFEESSQLKSENLPFYANFLADVASNFLTNILTGNKDKSQVFKEAGVGAINGGLIALSQAAQGNQVPTTVTPTPTAEAVSIYAQALNGTVITTERVTALVPGKNYVVTINFAEIAEYLTQYAFGDKQPYVIINGATVEGGSSRLVLSADELRLKKVQFDITGLTTSRNISATFFAPKAVGQAGVEEYGPYTQTFTVSNVRGATIILPRGPMPKLR